MKRLQLSMKLPLEYLQSNDNGTNTFLRQQNISVYLHQVLGPQLMAFYRWDFLFGLGKAQIHTFSTSPIPIFNLSFMHFLNASHMKGDLMRMFVCTSLNGYLSMGIPSLSQAFYLTF